jgi:hypothetical protein
MNARLAAALRLTGGRFAELWLFGLAAALFDPVAASGVARMETAARIPTRRHRRAISVTPGYRDVRNCGLQVNL